MILFACCVELEQLMYSIYLVFPIFLTFLVLFSTANEFKNSTEGNSSSSNEPFLEENLKLKSSDGRNTGRLFNPMRHVKLPNPQVLSREFPK
jgi:hypothetical protein